MATDFWASSHHKRWIIDRATLKHSRAEDLLYVEDPEYLDFLGIYFGNLISKLGKKLQLRQRVIATATIFFRRFYLRNSYCETDPFIVVAACCYVAAKAEESPVHIKNVVTEARLIYANEEYGIKSFPSDNIKLAEMEFYLVGDLECDLVVFHPYRTLMTLCGKTGSGSAKDIEAGEAGVGVDDGVRYWGTGEGKLELNESALQMAWFIINDTYRSDICLIYPPHLIAIAAIYLTIGLHDTTRSQLQLPSSSNMNASQPQPTQPNHARRSSRPTNSTLKKHQPQDLVAFLAGLNVNMAVVATISQEIISLYTLWQRFKENGVSDASLHSHDAFGISRQKSLFGGIGTPSSLADTEGDTGRQRQRKKHTAVVTPAFLTQVLLKMREAKMADLNHPVGSRPYDKRLERAQNAG